jgi:ribosome-interacting GTPase 1
MPANLTPDYLAAERDYKAARTHAEKVSALEKMLATIPRHKGTEKLQADLKRRLSQARNESHKKGAAHSTPFYLIDREGAGQVAVAGPPNSGKSRLVSALTNARPEVADYPFTTRFPTPGMMLFEDVQIQLIDTPPLSPEFTEPWLPQVLRNADMIAIVVDGNDPELLDQLEFVERTCEHTKITRPRLLIASKMDVPGAPGALSALEELFAGRFPILGVSALTGHNLDAFRRAVFDALGVVRMYTKAPGKKADLATPYILRRGQTVQDAARLVHKDFAEHLKFARLFPRSAGEGLMIERTHLVRDGDILEFHI